MLLEQEMFSITKIVFRYLSTLSLPVPKYSDKTEPQMYETFVIILVSLVILVGVEIGKKDCFSANCYTRLKLGTHLSIGK